MARLTIERPDGIEVIECRSVAEWLEAEQWPALHIYDGDRRMTADDAAQLLDHDADLRAVDVPGEPMTIVYAAIAVLAAGYSYYMAMSMTPPALGNQNQNAGSTNNSLGERQNQPVKIGQRIPEIWGGVPRAYPLILSQWRQFDDKGNEYDAAYMLLGRGEYHLNEREFREGDQLVEQISGSNLTVWGPNKSPWRTSPANNAPQLQIVNDGDFYVIDRLPQIVSEISGVDGQTLTPPNQVTTSKLLLIKADGWIDIEDATVGETLADIYGIGDTITLSDCFSWEHVDTVDNSYGANMPVRYFLRHSLDGTYTVVDNDGQRVQVTPGAQPGWAYIPVGGQYQASQAVFGNPLGVSGPLTGITGYGPTFPAGSYGGTTAIVNLRTEYYSPINSALGRLTVGPFSIPDWADEIVINFAAPNGIYGLPSDGSDAVAVGVSVTATVNYLDNTTYATGGVVFYNMADVRTATGLTMSVVLDPQSGRTVTLSRGDTSRLFSGTIVDEVKVREIYAVKYLPADWNPGNVTTVAMIQTVTQSALKTKTRKLSVPAIRKITNNASDDGTFAIILPAMHADPFNGRRGAGSIDTTALGLIEDQIQAATLAGDYPATGLRCGYTFDEKNQTYEDQLRLLCNAANLQPYSIGGDISFLWRWLRDVSVLVTHRDIMPGTFTRNRQLTPSREFSGVELTYTDSADGENVTISLDAGGQQREINLAGQNYAEMATLAMNSERARQLYVRQFCEFEVGLLGLRLAVGMRVMIEDCTRLTNAAGEILAQDGQIITTSQPVPDGLSSVWLSRRDGSIYQLSATKTGAKQITLGSGLSPLEAIYTDWQERKTRYAAWGALVALPPLDMEITEISPVSATQVRIKAQTYDSRVYQWPLS